MMKVTTTFLVIISFGVVCNCTKQIIHNNLDDVNYTKSNIKEDFLEFPAVLPVSPISSSSSSSKNKGGTTTTTIRPPSMEIEMDIPSHCRQNEFQIHSQEDLQELSNCEVVVGNVIVQDFDYPIITFSNLEKILGNLTIKKSPEVVRIEAPILQLISGTFNMFELTSLALISYPALKWVNVLDWKILPILSNVHFNNEIQGIESITISDTSLTGFLGFLANTIDNLDINNNRFLDTIESNVEIIRGKLHIGANANDAKVSLPKLKQINRLSISNVERLNLDELESVDDSLSLANNHFQQIKFPKLSFVGGTLSLSGNEMVNDLEFPNLSELGGGLVMTNNTLIERVNFFPKLRIIGGALEMVGAIKEISLKNLKLCKGSASVKSTSPLFDCARWSRSEIILVVRGGKIECTDANNEKITSRTKDDGGELLTNSTIEVEYHENKKSNVAISTSTLSVLQFVAIIIITLIFSLVSV